MVFDPKTWADGELITAADLNRVEQAVDAVDGQVGSKVDATDPRLSDARTPTAHQHAVADVDGLQTTIDRLTVGTGWREIDWLPVGNTVNGSRVLRQGSQVTLIIDVVLSSALGTTRSRTEVVPAGFRPAQAAAGGGQSALLTSYNSVAPAAQMYVNSSGSIYLYGVVDGARVRQGVTWQTTDPWPTTLPGTPA